MIPNPSGSDVLTTRPTPFELPLQSSDYIDDIRDNAGKLAIQLYGSLSDPKIIARRDYVIRAVNSFDDMREALRRVIDSPWEPGKWRREVELAFAKAEGR